VSYKGHAAIQTDIENLKAGPIVGASAHLLGIGRKR